MTSEEFKKKFDKIVEDHGYSAQSARKEDISWLISDIEELLSEESENPIE